MYFSTAPCTTRESYTMTVETLDGGTREIELREPGSYTQLHVQMQAPSQIRSHSTEALCDPEKRTMATNRWLAKVFMSTIESSGVSSEVLTDIPEDEQVRLVSAACFIFAHEDPAEYLNNEGSSTEPVDAAGVIDSTLDGVELTDDGTVNADDIKY